MFAELLAAHLVLKGWKQNPTATKREIGVWGHWKEDDEENQCPLWEAEVQRMKSFLRGHAPTGFRNISRRDELMQRGFRDCVQLAIGDYFKDSRDL